MMLSKIVEETDINRDGFIESPPYEKRVKNDIYSRGLRHKA